MKTIKYLYEILFSKFSRLSYYNVIMNSQSILKEISKNFHNNKDKYDVHHKIKKHIEEQCHDKIFIQDVIKDSINKRKIFAYSTNLFFIC